jgi:SAM-dependent methyltransferase
MLDATVSPTLAPALHLACAACGAAPGANGERQLYVKNGCAIRQCAHCGTAYAQPLPGSFSPETYYTEDYFNGGHADGYADYLGSQTVLAQEFARTREYLASYSPGGHLLEIGCAYGVFLQQAAPHYRAAGIEIAAHAAQHCQAAGLDVTAGVASPELLASLAERYGAPDVMVMLDVIEHIPAPHETLALMAAHLKPGGHVLITTGDFGSVLARATGKAWRLMTPPQHLWYFTARGLSRLAERNGLEVVRIDYPAKRVPLSLICYQLLRTVGLKPRLPAWLSRVQVPVNLFDAMRVVLRKPSTPLKAAP